MIFENDDNFVAHTNPSQDLWAFHCHSSECCLFLWEPEQDWKKKKYFQQHEKNPIGSAKREYFMVPWGFGTLW